jgi:hypothetical protein
MNRLDFVTHEVWRDLEGVYVQLTKDALERAARTTTDHLMWKGRLEGVEKLWSHIQTRLEEIQKEKD